jgi:hypothetical protein
MLDADAIETERSTDCDATGDAHENLSRHHSYTKLYP